MKKVRLGLWAALPFLALAGACASQGGTPTFDEASIVSDSRFADYEKVYIADVTISDELRNREAQSRRNSVGSDDRPVTERDLQAKAADLKKQLKREISRSKQIVSAPGEGVLTVQAELLDLVSSRPTMADFAGEPALSSQSRYVGGADIRVTIMDGERMLATVTENYQGSFTDQRGNSIWGDANHGIYIAANKVARLLG